MGQGRRGAPVRPKAYSTLLGVKRPSTTDGLLATGGGGVGLCSVPACTCLKCALLLHRSLFVCPAHTHNRPLASQVTLLGQHYLSHRELGSTHSPGGGSQRVYLQEVCDRLRGTESLCRNLTREVRRHDRLALFA
jgi:hypothetical protein